MQNYERVRLNREYIDTIKFLAKKYFDSTEVRIFGSRADLSRKGGDIDIYIKTSKTKDILKLKLMFLRDFYKKFGEQKVDLIVEYDGAENNIIYTEAKKNGVVI